MKICFIGSANSAHLVKWCAWFSGRGHELHVISFYPGEIPDATTHLIDLGVDADGGDAGKLKYLTTGGRIRRLVHEINPDVINVHYASSYGIAVALSGISGYVLSVWGSDIFDFPRRSPFHKALLKLSLRRPALLFSTSQAMADEAAKYTNRSFVITPFGVDINMFHPAGITGRVSSGKSGVPDDEPEPENIVVSSDAIQTDSVENNDVFTVGTIKTLSDVYGIRDLLTAVAEIKKEGRIPIALRIAGSGPQEDEYKQLAIDLGIDDITTWLGYISQEQCVTEWNRMDIGIIPSENESFGVAAVEAQACGTPLIISEADGLMESTLPRGINSFADVGADNNSTDQDNITAGSDTFSEKTDSYSAIAVPINAPHAIARAIQILYDNRGLRERMGMTGRKNVEEKYELNKCFLRIEKYLKRIEKLNK